MSSDQPTARGPFPNTHWSVVLAGGDEPSDRRAEALSTLCRTYWYPLYAFVRALGYSQEDAKDFTQGFFAHLLEKETLSRVRRGSGRFRSFLLGSLKNYVAESHRKARALKRGGETILISLDAELGEEKFSIEPADERTPEMLYHRNWAEALLNVALDRLRGDYEKAGKLPLFEQLEPYLSGNDQVPTYPEMAEKLHMTVSAVTSAIFRVRRRYAELVKEAIADTVESSEEIEEELQFLFAALRG